MTSGTAESKLVNARSRTSTRIRAHSLTQLRGVVWRMRVVDGLLILLSVTVGEISRFGMSGWLDLFSSRDLAGTPVFYALLPVPLTLAWSLALQVNGAYDHRRLGTGPQAYTSILRSTGVSFILLALVSYILKLQISRGFVIVTFPVAALLLTLTCWQWRVWLLRGRLQGAFLQRTLVVGRPGALGRIIPTLTHDSGPGYQVVAACSNIDDKSLLGVPVVGQEANAGELARQLDVDTVICASGDMNSDDVRRLGWSLERTGIELIIASSLHDVRAQRVTNRTVQGLHLLLVEPPHFSDWQLLLKSGLDRVLGVLLLILATPVLAVAALLIKREDGGPVLLHQTRVGLDGQEFPMLKFRSMVPNAEGMRAELIDEVEDAVDRGPMFKRRNDPRITRIGRILRRTSIDELPQLINVVRGDMSLVGPRPPLPHEVTSYTPVAKRRLLVRPGMTGLWQINGRSDLSWDDTIRLDLYYVENWSVTFDLLILFRTAKAVLQQKGAY